jgi:hypothetical protein
MREGANAFDRICSPMNPAHRRKRHALFRSACGTAVALLVAAALPGGEPGAASGGPDSEASKIGAELREVLLGRGEPILCPGCPAEPPIRVDVASGLSTEVSLPYERIDQVAIFPDGKRILAAVSSEKGKHGLLLVLSTQTLAPLGRLDLPGIGDRLAVFPDGYSAAVLCHRAGRGRSAGQEEERSELVIVDLGRSAVKESFPLPKAAYDLAISENAGRIFVGMEDRLLSFTTAPLSASWFYRSPGVNRRVWVRPRQGEIYVLRDSSIAVFPAAPKANPEDSSARDDDAAAVLQPPLRLDRLRFSDDGRAAVAAGRGLDVMIFLDAQKRRFAGVWPEDAPAIRAVLDSLAAETPRGPRGRLVTATGFGPPLQPVPKPSPAPPSEPIFRMPESGPSRPAPEPERELSVPPPRVVLPRAGGKEPVPAETPENGSLEEVNDPILSGGLSGERSLVSFVVLLGPNSLTTIHDQAAPAPDGTYSFKLPRKGRYRIMLMAPKGVTLSVSPPFRTVDVEEFGFRGLDFRILGAIGGAPRNPPIP